MMNALRQRKTVLVLMLLVLSSLLLGCQQAFSRPGETVTQTEAVEPEGAESARVNVQAGFGEVTLGSGAAGLFDGEFRYNYDELAVNVDYRVAGDEGVLTIRPQENRFNTIPTGNVVSEWDLQFAEGVPLDMDVNLGLGTSNLDFSELTLTGLAINSGAGDVTVDVGRQTLDEVQYRGGLGSVNLTLPGGSVDRLDFEAGAGDIEIDLTGTWEADMLATIQRGLGTVTLRLPSDVGVHVEVEQGLGNVDAEGFTIRDGAYVNEAYGGSGPALQIEISEGLGDVNLVLE